MGASAAGDAGLLGGLMELGKALVLFATLVCFAAWLGYRVERRGVRK